MTLLGGQAISVGYTYLTNSAPVEHLYFTNGSTHVMTTIKSYDGLNRLTGIQTQDDQASTLAAFAYGYNPANQRVAVTNVNNSRWVCDYDDSGQVTSGRKYLNDETPVC